MYPPAGSETEIKSRGFVIAAIGFVVTRVTVLETLVIGELTLTTALSQLLPLVVGLGLVVFGVSLAVSTFDRTHVNTVVRWCVYGTVGMSAVVGIALVQPGGEASMYQLLTDGVAANAILGGALGGCLIGLRSASNREQRRLLARQTDQGTLLNRLLRHEVLNAIAAIRGHAELLYEEPDDRSLRAIRDSVDRIERTIGDVGFLVRAGDDRRQWLTSVSLPDAVEESVASVRDETAGRVEFSGRATDVKVRGDDHLSVAVAELLRYATRGGEATVTVTTAAHRTEADVRISSTEPWLTDEERVALTERLPEFDTPSIGYGISIARLLVDQYGGRIRVEDDDRTAVVTLPRTAAEQAAVNRPGVTPAALQRVTVVALIAGVVMGVAIQQFSGGIPVIGALYGVDTAAVGWITHLFHSVMFGVLFAAVVSHPRISRFVDSIAATAVAGVVYGVLLWLVAAGVVMSVWLNAVGIPASLPNLTLEGLLSHVLWGAILGVGYGLLERR